MALADILRIIAKQDAQNNFLRKHKAGSAIGFFDPSGEPLVTNTVEVVGPIIVVQTKEGLEKRRARARVVTKDDGEIEVISGGFNSRINEADAKKILPTKVTRRLSKAFKIK